MSKKTYITIFFVAMPILLCRPLYSWEQTYTHPALTKKAVGLSQVDNYLKNELGISEGISTQLQFYTYIWSLPDLDLVIELWERGLDLDMNNRTILDWIKEGSKLEDAKLYQARSRHHFLDPYRNAGLDNKTDHPNYSSFFAWLTDIFSTEFDVTGESALHWATEGTSTKQPTTNYQTWECTRQYFYKALTEETQDVREHYLVLTFLSIGHLLHLVEDMGVPAHTRNDFLFAHYQPPFGLGNPLEGWVEEQVKANGGQSPWSGTGPIVFNKLAKYFDADAYTGGYSGDGICPPTNLWGLAECTNYQFLSLSTVFGCSGIKYQFPHPAREHTEPNLFSPAPGGEKVYFNGSNYCVTHLARDSYTHYVSTGFGYNYFPVIDSTITTDDEKVFIDYANITIPRTIDYATGLINYFFRGRLSVEQKGQDGIDIVITITNISNNSAIGQTLKGGTFELYWDDPAGNRTLVDNFIVYEPAPSCDPWNSSTSTLQYEESTEAIFTIPDADIENYILVYKGNVCQQNPPSEPDPDDQDVAIATVTFNAPNPNFISVWKLNSSGSFVWGYDTGNAAYCIDVDSSSNVYVGSAQSGGYSVRKLNSTGSFVWGYDTGGDVRGIDIDSSGNVYVAGFRSGGKSVWKLNNSGSLIWDYDTGDKAHNIAVDCSGNVHIAGIRNGGYSVWKLNSSGEFVWGYDAGQITVGIAVDSSNYVYVCGISNGYYDVYKLNSSGLFVCGYNTGFGSVGVDIDSSGNFYICSCRLIANTSVFKLNSSCSYVWDYDTGKDTFDIAIGNSNCIHVAGYRSNYKTIWKLSSDGMKIWDYDTRNAAYGIAVDSSNNVYVAGDRVLIP